MNSKPGIVVVETSVNPSHGSKVGQTLTVDDMPQDDITNVFQQFGRMLAVERFPARSQIWQVKHSPPSLLKLQVCPVLTSF